MTQTGGLAQQTKLGVAYSFAGRIGGTLVVFAGTVVLARLLEVRDFGIVALCFMLVDLATKVGDFGFVTAIVQQRDEVLHKQVNTLFLIDVALKTLLFGALMLGMPMIARYFHEPRLATVMPAIGLYMIIDSFSGPSLALLSRQMRFGVTARIDFFSRSAEMASAVGMALLGFGVWSLVLSRVLGSALTALLGAIAARWRPGLQFDFGGSIRLVRFGGWLFFRNLFYYIGDNVDRFFIGRYLGAQQVGYYSKAFELMRLPQARLTWALCQVLFAAFSRRQDQPERVGYGLQKAVLVTSLISYPALIGVALVAPELVDLLFGAKWQPMVLPLQIMCLAGLLHAVDPFLVVAVTALGNVKMAAFRRLVELVLLVVTIFVAVKYGLAGVAAAVVLVALLMALLMAALVRVVQLQAWRDYFRPQLPALGATAVMAGAVGATRYLTRSLSLSGPLTLGVLIVAGVLGYAGILLITRPARVVALWKEAGGDLAQARNRLRKLVGAD